MDSSDDENAALLTSQPRRKTVARKNVSLLNLCFTFAIMTAAIVMYNTPGLAEIQTPIRWQNLKNIAVIDGTIQLPVGYDETFRRKLYESGIQNVANECIDCPNCTDPQANIILSPVNASSCMNRGTFHQYECKFATLSTYYDLEPRYPKSMKWHSFANPWSEAMMWGSDYHMVKSGIEENTKLIFGANLKDYTCVNLFLSERRFNKASEVSQFRSLISAGEHFRGSKPKILIINRKVHQRGRRILNWESLQSSLSVRYDVDYLDDYLNLEKRNMTVVQRMNYINQHSVLITTHGQQLMNFIYMPKCSIVIELLTRCFWTEIYAQFVAEMFHLYGYVYDQTSLDCDSTFAHIKTHWDPHPYHATNVTGQANEIMLVLSHLLKQREKCLRGKLPSQDAILAKIGTQVTMYYQGMEEKVWTYQSLYDDYQF